MPIGETLAEARRQAGLTVTQVSERTRIRETIIRGSRTMTVGLRSSARPQAIMSVAARRPRLCGQPAAGAFPLVIGSLRFDLTVLPKPSACRAGG